MMDSVYLGRGELARTNADQVARIRRVLTELSMEIATPDDARQMLGPKGADAVAWAIIGPAGRTSEPRQ